MSALAPVLAALFWGIVVLSVLVFVHEGGHYLSARACGCLLYTSPSPRDA